MRRSSHKTLEALAASIGPAAVKALVAEIRAAKPGEIDALLSAPTPAARARPAKDPLLAEITALLAPVLARSSEKADLLTAHLRSLTGRVPDIKRRGLAATVRALRKVLSEDEIRDGAYGLRVALQREHSLRERVK
jgi:hypothetical protein